MVSPIFENCRELESAPICMKSAENCTHAHCALEKKNNSGKFSHIVRV
jgi:hypothetical protein